MTVVRVIDEVAVVKMAWQIDCTTEAGLVDCGNLVEMLIRDSGIEKIGIERFNISGRTLKLSRQYEALYMIGIVKFLVGQSDVDLLMQSPADAKTIWTNQRIDANLDAETILTDVKVPKPHGLDSLRHALLASRFVGVIPPWDGDEEAA